MTIVLAITGASFLSGCVNQPKPGTPESAYALNQKKIERADEAKQKIIDAEPDWYSKPPADTTEVLYAVTQARHDDSALARIAAFELAKGQMAGKIESYVSTRVTQFFGDKVVGTGNTVSIDGTTKTVAPEVIIRGLSERESKAVVAEGKVTVYLLTAYPLGEANRLLVEQIQKDEALDLEASKNEAFKELEAEVERLKQG